MNFSPFHREKIDTRPNPLHFGAFASEIGCSCSEKEQNAVFSVKHIEVQLIREKLVAPYLLC